MGSGPQSGDYTVSGDAVNVAARLQQTAEPERDPGRRGTARRLSAEAFAFAPLSELSAEGPERGDGGVAPGARAAGAATAARRRGAAWSGAPESSPRWNLRWMMPRSVAAGSWPWPGKPASARAGWRSRCGSAQRGTASPASGHSSRSYATAFPYHLIAQLVEQLLTLAPGDDAAASLRALGVAADEPTLERWAAVLHELGDESSDDPRLADVSPAGRQRLLVHAVVGACFARWRSASPCSSCSTTCTGPIRPALRSSRSSSTLSASCRWRCWPSTGPAGPTAGTARAATSSSTCGRWSRPRRVSSPSSACRRGSRPS